MKRDFKHKTVLITGASGGLGKALCFRFGNAGARIIGLDLDEIALAKLQDELQQAGIEASYHACDVTDEAACNEVVTKSMGTFGGVDLIVNNAGVTHLGTARNTSAAKVRRVMEINYLGSIYCTLAALDSLVQRKGMVIAISSVAGFAPLYGRSAYAGSKHALHGYFDTLRAELAPEGVDVMLVSPSFINTPIRTRSMGLDPNKGNQNQHTTGLHYTPKQVADEIFQAATRRKRFLITGATGKKSYWVNKFLPRLFEKLMVSKMAPPILEMERQVEKTPVNEDSIP